MASEVHCGLDPVGVRRQVPAETTAAARRIKGWTPPCTPWGHPDLQGIWTSDDMRSVPTARPEAMAGRRPWTIRMTITTQPDYQLYEYACHEGNGAVKYALSGELAYDKAVADAVAKELLIPRRDTLSPYGPPAPGTAPARIVNEQ